MSAICYRCEKDFKQRWRLDRHLKRKKLCPNLRAYIQQDAERVFPQVHFQNEAGKRKSSFPFACAWLPVLLDWNVRYWKSSRRLNRQCSVFRSDPKYKYLQHDPPKDGVNGIDKKGVIRVES